MVCHFFVKFNVVYNICLYILTYSQNGLICKFHKVYTTDKSYRATDWCAIAFNVNKSLNLAEKLHYSQIYIKGRYYNTIR